MEIRNELEDHQREELENLGYEFPKVIKLGEKGKGRIIETYDTSISYLMSLLPEEINKRGKELFLEINKLNGRWGVWYVAFEEKWTKYTVGYEDENLIYCLYETLKYIKKP